MLSRDRDRGRDPERPPEARMTAPVGPNHQPVRAIANLLRSIEIRHLRRPVCYDLHAGHRAPTSHITNAAVSALERPETGVEHLPQLPGPVPHAVADDDLEHLVADRRREGVVDMRRVEAVVALDAHLLDRSARDVTTALSGIPFPSVLLGVRISGE